MLVFVYGTLLRGQRNHAIIDGQRFIGDARLKDYALYAVSSYPAAKEKKHFDVFGEVYKVSAKTEKALDHLEGVEHGLFGKKTVGVILNDNTIVEALVYVAVKGTLTFKAINDKIQIGQKDGQKWNPQVHCTRVL